MNISIMKANLSNSQECFIKVFQRNLNRNYINGLHINICLEMHVLQYFFNYHKRGHKRLFIKELVVDEWTR
jgi:hypothetical protein